MRKLASIVRIESCEPIPETDRLSVTTMEGKGWRVVTSRDEFTPGELAVYFEIDSYLPKEPQFEFLADRCLRKFCSKAGNVLKEGYRIRTVKLRGVVSQGLLMPIKAFEKLPYLLVDGQDVSEILGVEHYDEVAEALAPVDNSAKLGHSMKPFPSAFIPKTDEERIQNLQFLLHVAKGRAFEVTEKNDGSSITMFYSTTIDPLEPFGVCSRNWRLKPDEGAVPWAMAKKYNVEEGIKKAAATLGCELAFQGELVGPGVNGNRDLYKEHEWHVFKVFDITHGCYLLPDSARKATELAGFTYVPVIEKEFKVFDKFETIDEILAYAEGKTAKGNEREGFVFKSCTEPYMTFKAVSNRYLLKLK